MGGKFSKAQVVHLEELGELTRSSIVIVKNQGKALPLPSKKDLCSLLTYIYAQCPAYPEKGSLKVSTWIKLGTYFHKQPRAPPKILATWRIIMECLKIHDSAFQDAVLEDPPPPYSSKEDGGNQKKALQEERVDTLPIVTEEIEVCAPSAPFETPSPIEAVAGAVKTARECGDFEPEDLDQYSLCPVEYVTNTAGVITPRLEPLPIKLIRDLKQATSLYGIQAPYVKGLLRSMSTGFFILPQDWKDLFRMILTGPQYVVWESDFCREAELTAQRVG